VVDIEAPQWDAVASFGTAGEIGLTFREDDKYAVCFILLFVRLFVVFFSSLF
jgi:hypothetical protein